MSRRRRGRDVHGVVLLDKPSGLSSNQALQKVRRLYNARKAGHTGSLDPLASGMLPICLGEASKTAGHMLDADKTYQATLHLGQATTTGDAEGDVIETAAVPDLDSQAIEHALERFLGESAQVPPMYSALKVDGQPLYKRARAGEQVERAARTVEIYGFELLSFKPGDQVRITVRVRCSKGTYIRSLAEDLGAALGVPAHVSTLRRCQSGPFTLDDSVTPEQLTALKESGTDTDLDALLQPIESCIQHLPRLSLSEAATFYIRQGQPVLVPNGPQSGMVRIADAGGLFLGVGDMRDDGKLAPKRLLAQ